LYESKLVLLGAAISFVSKIYMVIFHCRAISQGIVGMISTVGEIIVDDGITDDDPTYSSKHLEVLHVVFTASTGKYSSTPVLGEDDYETNQEVESVRFYGIPSKPQNVQVIYTGSTLFICYWLLRILFSVEGGKTEFKWEYDEVKKILEVQSSGWLLREKMEIIYE
jgi:hypothetical protein